MHTLMPFSRRIALITLILSVTACHPSVIKKVAGPEDALKPVRFFPPAFEDDLDRESLIQAVERDIEYLQRIPSDTLFTYGTKQFTCTQVKASHAFFLKLLRETRSADTLVTAVRENFLVFKAAGGTGSGDVLFTGYFEPVYPASLKPDATFAYPIYRKPDDQVRIDLGLFTPELKGRSIVARIDGNRVLPYYTRKCIDGDRVLAGRGLEIAWLRDPLDAAFLQIQGSGRLALPDGTSLDVGYAETNGHPYRAIGRTMIDKGYLTPQEMSMQRIRQYLEAHPDLIQAVLDTNPSYVFFRPVPNGPLGSIGVTLTPGRSLATDAALFPKGALAFITCQKPVEKPGAQAIEWEPFSRFVLIQDTGGAIKGAGRADIFWGQGPYAELAAGHLRHEGELYVLIKKP